jgi:uncharacterized iron-regulated membrane protein
MTSTRRLCFDLHSWIGLKLCVFMAFVCLTGTLAVLAHEIDWALHPQMRVEPAPAQASWGQQLDAARAAYPDWEVSRISAPVDTLFASQFTAKTPQGRSRFIWVDPYRGAVTGDTAWFNAHRFLRNMHRHLMMPTKIGVPIVSALGVALLLTLVTSLVIYRKWWKGLFTWPRRERSRRFWGDLHRLVGVWSLWFVLLIGLTGVWYLVESLGGKAPSPPWKTLARAEAGIADSRIDGAALDAAMAQASRDWPGLRVTGAALNEAKGLITLEGQADAILVRERANALRYQASGPLLQRVAGTDLGLHQRISEMADPLHFGNFAGLPVKLLWFGFGALLTLLSLTGAYLYGMRACASLRTGPRRDAGTAREPAALRAWALAWVGMARWRWLWLLLIAAGFILLPRELAR